MSDMEWMQSVNVGDAVVQCNHTIVGTSYYERLVVRVTPTMFILNSGAKWNRKTGKRVGGGSDVWNHEWLLPLDDNARKKLAAQEAEEHRGKLAYRLSQWPWRQQSLEALERVLAVLEEEAP